MSRVIMHAEYLIRVNVTQIHTYTALLFSFYSCIVTYPALVPIPIIYAHFFTQSCMICRRLFFLIGHEKLQFSINGDLCVIYVIYDRKKVI